MSLNVCQNTTLASYSCLTPTSTSKRYVCHPVLDMTCERSSQGSWKTSYLASGAKGKLEREHYWTQNEHCCTQWAERNENTKCVMITTVTPDSQQVGKCSHINFFGLSKNKNNTTDTFDLPEELKFLASGGNRTWELKNLLL